MAPEILHADDDKLYRSSIKSNLLERGHTVAISCASVEEIKASIPQILARGIKVAILDARMPYSSDGYEAANILKAAVGGIKIIALTANPAEAPWADRVFDKVDLSGKMMKELAQTITDFYTDPS